MDENNIDQNVQPEVTPAAEPVYETARDKQLEAVPNMDHVQRSKMGLFISLSIFLGIVSILTLFLVLRTKNNLMETNKEPLMDIEEVQETTVSYDEENNMLINLEKEVFELDKLGIEKVEKDYAEAIEKF